jgi:photosystem II stability/assembly factor-like uncharacterized protein
MPGAEFNVAGVRGCADPCVTGLRFATDRIGYAFGPTAVLLTTDGGQSWKRQAGLGADALETLGGNVIVARAIGAAPALLTAPIGSTRWTPRSTDGWPRTAKRLWLGRSGGAAALQFSTYDTGTGTGKANAGALFRSSDDGATWTRVDDPCPYIGAGYWNVSTAAALAPDGTVVVGCGSGGGDDPNFYGGGTITSTDGGRTFETPVTGGKVGGARLLAAVDKQTQIEYAPKEACGCVGNLRLYRSTDAGNSWTPVAGVSVKDVTFIGFESAAVGRIVTGGGKAIWTTRDGGASWTEVVFS